MKREDIEKLLKEKRKGTTFVPDVEKPYVEKTEDNLVPGVEKSYFESELSEGDGDELGGELPKFHSIASSSALAVNTFAVFKDDKFKSTPIQIGGHEIPASADMCFEKKFENGLFSPKKPNLDVVFEFDKKMIAIEGKFLEPFDGSKREFAKAYEEKIIENPAEENKRRRESKWCRVLEKRIEEFGVDTQCTGYKYLDDVQLIKHAMGLLYDSDTKDKELHLCYLYWEPKNAEEIEEYKHYRKEIEDFSNEVKNDPSLHFFHLSYDELWETWETWQKWETSGNDALKEHVANLRNWYDVSVV